MENFVKFLIELINDCVPNNTLQLSLDRYCSGNTKNYLSDFNTNIAFMGALIDSSIDRNSKTVDENLLRYRAKLMNTYVIHEHYHSLYLLLNIVTRCWQHGLSLSKIDDIVDILQQENVISTFLRSHWLYAKTNGIDIFEDRCNVIRQCINFLLKMEMEVDMEDPNDAI